MRVGDSCLQTTSILWLIAAGWTSFGKNGVGVLNTFAYCSLVLSRMTILSGATVSDCAMPPIGPLTETRAQPGPDSIIFSGEHSLSGKVTSGSKPPMYETTLAEGRTPVAHEVVTAEPLIEQ